MTTKTISSGVTSSGLTVSSGATLEVLSGGVAVDTTVLSGGLAVLSAGGLGSGATISAGAELTGAGQMGGDVRLYGLASGVSFVDTDFPSAYDQVEVFSGGSTVGVRIGYHVTELVSSGGLASGGVVSSGGAEYAEPGGLVSRATIGNGAQLAVVSGGTAKSDAILSGGVETLNPGATASGEVIRAGGLQYLFRGAVVSAEQVRSGGELSFGDDVQSGEVLTATASAASAFVVDGVTLSAGAIFSLNGAARILSGATVRLAAGAPISEGEVWAGGLLVGPGRTDHFDAWGTVSGVAVVSSNYAGNYDGVLTVESGGLASGDTIYRAAREVVQSDGLASGEQVQSAAGLQVSSGGVAVGTRVSKGGIETILHGGQASATVLSGGTERDLGTASGTRILSGGREVISAHAAASRSVIFFGGEEVVSSGGVGDGIAVSGGTLSVLAGGSVAAGLTIHGGKAIISGSVDPGQWARFTGAAGVLELQNLAGFHAKISGLTTSGRKIDLDGFADSGTETVTWTQLGTSGSLTVTDGSKVASLTLIGSYVASDFHLARDGHGGTLVTAPQAVQAARMVETMGAFGGGRGGAAFAPAVDAAGAAAVRGLPPVTAPGTSGR